MPLVFRKQKPPPGTKRHSQFKRHLRIDFLQCCAYCHIHEGFLRLSCFGVEHFQPKTLFPDLQFCYENMLYGCNDCNRIKSTRWPSELDRAAGNRFLNPCDDDFEDHFFISAATGLANPLTFAGQYVIQHLQLNREELVSWRKRKRILQDCVAEIGEYIANQPSDPRFATLQANLNFLKAELELYGAWWTGTAKPAGFAAG